MGYDSNNNIVNSSVLNTAGNAVNIKITADRKKIKANNQDLSYITLELVDAKGYVNPLAENLLKFSVEGPATIAGTGNANPQSLESFQEPQRKAWRGKCLVILKAGRTAGKIKLTVTAEGMNTTSIEIDAE